MRSELDTRFGRYHMPWAVLIRDRLHPENELYVAACTSCHSLVDMAGDTAGRERRFCPGCGYGGTAICKEQVTAIIERREETP